MGNRRNTVLAVLAGLVLVSSACAGDKKDEAKTTTTIETGPTLAIVSPPSGSHIKGNVVTLDLDARNIKIVKADADRSGASGHFHVFIDKAPVAAGTVIEKGPGIIHSIEDPLTISGLTLGAHELTVVLGDGAHARLGSAQAKVSVIVDGPAIDATAPATVAAGQPLSIDVAVDGVQLIKADGDTSGATGHLHAFVDKDPVAPGQPIPTGDPAIIHSAVSPIVVSGLAPGEHTIWVVLGDGTHTAFAASVRDKITVTVQ